MASIETSARSAASETSSLSSDAKRGDGIIAARREARRSEESRGGEASKAIGQQATLAPSRHA
jgi:hypothetical protein